MKGNFKNTLTRTTYYSLASMVFAKKNSTNLAYIELMTNISQEIDNNESTLGVLLDLAKAFDTVKHEILLRKLYHYGIRGMANERLKTIEQLGNK